MLVCAHGEVSEYCKNRDMIIMERYTGKIENYRGGCRVLVTDLDMSLNEYCYLKGMMLAHGTELVSTRYVDSENLVYSIDKRENRGRRKFGDDSEAEMAVVRRIFEMRDAGHTMKEISEDENVRYLDGRRMTVSTIQVILDNRNKY